jgi:1,4-dihydroxy-2-naphthoyl-CoA synthase
MNCFQKEKIRGPSPWTVDHHSSRSMVDPCQGMVVRSPKFMLEGDSGHGVRGPRGRGCVEDLTIASDSGGAAQFGRAAMTSGSVGMS